MEMMGKIKPHVTLEAKIIRADGTVEDLGVIADSDHNTLELGDAGLTFFEKVRKMIHGRHSISG